MVMILEYDCSDYSLDIPSLKLLVRGTKVNFTVFQKTESRSGEPSKQQ